jgi:hypothetical protein
MSHDEWEEVLAAHDRWTAYDILVGILLTGAGLLLLAVGFVGLWGDMTGPAGLAVTAGAILISWALHREPYQAR